MLIRREYRHDQRRVTEHRLRAAVFNGASCTSDVQAIVRSMRIMIVTDAWFPQTNGVVHTLAQTAAWLGRFGHEVRLITPQDFRTFPVPDVSGDPDLGVSVQAGGADDRCVSAACCAHRDGRLARVCGAALLHRQ